MTHGISDRRAKIPTYAAAHCRNVRFNSGTLACYHAGMPRKPKLPADNPEQFKRFIDMAREVKVDESKGAVDRAFRRIVQLKRPTDKLYSPKKD
jgi:hypothetical protein